MRSKSISVLASLAAVFAIGTIQSLSAQTSAVQNRIAQQVVISGLRVDAALVLAPGGGVQSYSCPGPQQYVSTDGSSQGWACFDPTTNVWLLSALPPQQQLPVPPPIPAQIAVQQVVQQPVYAPVYSPVIYSYPVVQPAIIYRPAPRVVYAAPAPVYSSSAIIGAAAINAAGRIAAAVITGSGHHDVYRNVVVVQNRGRRH